MTTGEQAAEIKYLQSEVALLKDQLALATTSLASTSKKRAATLAFEGGDQVAGIGKKFAMTEELWIDRNIFNLPRNFTGHPDTPERFATDDSYTQGTVAALYNGIPEDLREHMDKAEFRSTVRLYFLLIIHFLVLIILCSVFFRSKRPAIFRADNYYQPRSNHFWCREQQDI